ncbi:MAG: hypothetical protein ACR2LK_02825 [Solirubrobacteraceae bacterium]
MSRIKSIYAAIAQRLRKLAGLEEGETLHPLMVALYSILGLTFIILLLAAVTGTPLECLPTGLCER